MRIPRDDASDIEWLLFEQDRVLTTAQATAALGRGVVRGKLKSGQWRRACRGILVTHNGPPTRRQILWVATLAAGPGSVLTGLGAAIEGGLRLGDHGPLHVLIPDSRARADLDHRLPQGFPVVRVHRGGSLLTAHTQLGRPPRTTMARAVVDAGQWARSDDEARTILAAACQQRRVTADETLAVLAEMSRVRRRALMTRTLRDIAGGAEALAEIDFLALCRRAGLPTPDLQLQRTDSAGSRRRLDAYWRDYGVHAEIDGAHHMDARHWAADMKRQNDLWIAGDRVLRFPAWLVRDRPAEVADDVRAALIAAGWRETRRSRKPLIRSTLRTSHISPSVEFNRR